MPYLKLDSAFMLRNTCLKACLNVGLVCVKVGALCALKLVSLFQPVAFQKYFTQLPLCLYAAQKGLFTPYILVAYAH